MGLLTILKKMKQKERELRLLMLYPPGRRSREGSGGTPPGGRCQAPPTGRGVRGRRVPTAHCASRTWALPIAPGGGREEAVPPARGRGGDSVPKAKGEGLNAQRPDQMSLCKGGGGPGGDSDVTTRRSGSSVRPLSCLALTFLPPSEGARPRPRPQGRNPGGVRAPPCAPRGGGCGRWWLFVPCVQLPTSVDALVVAIPPTPARN